jgi:hypothetical protein
MKKITSLIAAAACTVSAIGALPITSSADENIVYGTMDIPYAEFYANEGIGCEVDAVSSATTSKWCNNSEGGLVQGTYNEANADGTGTILGVTYPVAISAGDLENLGDSNYNFTALDTVPEAYKEVTVSDGQVSFSAVVDNEIEQASTTLTVETDSRWGDYCVTINSLSYDRGATESSIGKLYGCIVTDTNGNNYAMRHLENIWKNELGINVLEGATDAHGAALSYANYTGLNGATIDTITYITNKGYYIYDVDPDAYLAKKVTGEFSVADAKLSAGSTAVKADLPDDYDAEFTLIGLDGGVSDGIITFADALAGSYTVSVSDKSGVYESLSATFTLTTDEMPAAYSDGKIVKADGADDAEYSNFVKNISAVSVNGTSYSASGKGSVTIIGADGTIDFDAVSKNENVFDGSGVYEIAVTSAGYNNALEFKIDNTASKDEPVEKPTEEPTEKPSDEPTDEPTENPETTVSLGDVDDSGTIDAIDASLVLTAYALKATGQEVNLDEEHLVAADANKDGAADAVDASLILSYYAFTATGGTDSFDAFLNK